MGPALVARGGGAAAAEPDAAPLRLAVGDGMEADSGGLLLAGDRACDPNTAHQSSGCNGAYMVALDGLGVGSKTICFQTSYQQGASPLPTCSDPYYCANPVWLKFVATAACAKIDTCGATTAEIPDTVLAVYRGSCTSLTELACNDDTPGCNQGVGSQVVVEGLTIGTTYWIQVGVRAYESLYNPHTNGNYTVRIECNSVVCPCALPSCTGVAENEVKPCDVAARVNDGCDMVPPAFGTIRCDPNSAKICGTTMFDPATGTRDTDWYRLVLPQAATITWKVNAQFVPDFRIIAPGPDPNNPCVGRTVLAQNDPNAFTPCTQAAITYNNAPPGTYWLYIAPALNANPNGVACGRPYLAEVTTTPCNPATGACCNATNPSNPTCSVTTAANCTGTTKHYWGDGTTCPPGNGCWVCPPGADVSAEVVCSDGYVDTYDSGCAYSETSPPVNELVCGHTMCGTSGTFVKGGSNARDNDWYFVDFTYNGNNPVWTDPADPNVPEARQITISAYAEFDAEVLIWDFLTPQNPCAGTVDTSVDVFGKAGQPIQFSFCKAKVADPAHPYGDFFVVVRPAFFGTAREIPCGSHYWLHLECQTVLPPCPPRSGACCLQGYDCLMLTRGQCEAQGGRFAGESIACADTCCPCQASDAQENEPDCYYGDVNGGCYASHGFGTQLSTPGSAICGTSVRQWVCPGENCTWSWWLDEDWFEYHHPGGDIVLCVTAEFPAWAEIIKPGLDPNNLCAGRTVLAAGQGGANCEEFCLTAANQPAGSYWLRITGDPRIPVAHDGSGQFECGARYRASVFATGACCLGAVGCEMMLPDQCSAQGGTFVPGANCQPDCSSNGIADACEPDCDGNGIADSCDILNNPNLDQNGNGKLDMCEGSPRPGIFTTYDDFDWGTDPNADRGTLINVWDDPSGQLQRNPVPETTPPPYICVAVSGRGTLVRIDTRTGQVLGEYYSAPNGRGRNPSRTTVDLDGSAWASNRDEADNNKGSVVKVGLLIGGTRCNADGTNDPNGQYLKPPFEYNTCQDRNADGLIKTSRGVGDVLPWPNTGGADNNGGVSTAEDECVCQYTRVSGTAARHISVNSQNDVWVGGYGNKSFDLLDSDTGQSLATFNAGAGGYGGLIDCHGVIWSAGANSVLLWYDTKNTIPTWDDANAALPVSFSYGVGIDVNGDVWNAQWTSNSIIKFHPDGTRFSGFEGAGKSTGGSGARGVACTLNDNHMWVANSYSNAVARLDNDGNILKLIPLAPDGSTPTGVAVDSDGKVWATCLDSNTVKRIDPNAGVDGLGAVDLTVGLGASAGPYNYSDMTGMVTLETSATGTWSAVHDGGVLGARWNRVTWNTENCASPPEPDGTSLTVQVRAANQESLLTSEPWTLVPASCAPFPPVYGRFVQLRVRFKGSCPGEDFATPVLCNLTVASVCPGDMNCDGRVTFADIDPFVEALSGESAWNQHHPGCPWLNADCNRDCHVTFADIDPFVAVIGTTCLPWP
jgi:streptogramin lyase